MRLLASKPLFPFEPKHHHQKHSNECQPQYGVRPDPLKFRHIFEIHPINPGDKGHRNKDGGHDRQYFRASFKSDFKAAIFFGLFGLNLI
jgi:hypothetical protein